MKHMLAKEIKTVEEAYALLPNHSVENKFDGCRAFIYTGKDFKVVNREGNEITHVFPEFEPLRKLPINAVFDCEIICLNENKKPDFQALQKRIHLQKNLDIEMRSRTYPAMAIVFDIVAYGGNKQVNASKLFIRQLQMEALLLPWIAVLPELRNILALSPKFTFDSADSFQHFWNETVVKGNLEGLMFKRNDSSYEFGKRSNSWKKYKNHKSVDLKIERFEETVGEKGNAGFVVYSHHKGNEIKIAVGGHEDRKRIKNGQCKIIEVEYLGETDSGRLRQPTCKVLK